MATIKFLKNLSRHKVFVLCEPFPISMSRLASIFLIPFLNFILKILTIISRYFQRSRQEGNGSNFSDNHSREDHAMISKTSTGLISSGLLKKESVQMQKCLEPQENIEETEDSVFLSKYQFTSGENVSEYVEEPIIFKFTVQEMFMGSNDCEVSLSKEPLEIEEEEKSSEEEFDSCSSTYDQDVGEHIHLENISEKEVDNYLERFLNEEIIHEEDEEKLNSVVEGTDYVENGIVMDDQDFSYEVQLLPLDDVSSQKIDETFLDHGQNQEVNETDSNSNLIEERMEDLDDEYIELEPPSVISADVINKNEELHQEEEEKTLFHGLEESNNSSWSSDSDDDEDDVLWEHQNLVQQMKMELKNCRIRGLPTISEECETLKTIDDLKPLEIHQKFEYKDIVEEIQKFYKSYSEKMRKLDVLNYQTLQAISFLQLKDSEVFTSGKQKSTSTIFNLTKIWPCKVRRIHSDSMHKSIAEMHRDLELVYVGQLCLSWEILTWLSMKAKELMEHDSKGYHSYNRVAQEFQQFQVLLQRFMEDEPFQGPRIQNYVKNRCMIRSLLQVPTIKDDNCLKDKKEKREEADTISLTLLAEIIRESMVIFRDFLRLDKGAANVVLKGIQGTNADFQDTTNSELLLDVIANLQKKDRRLREQMRSQNCIVKKLQKPQECGLMDQELLTSQVELRLVSRVLSMSRLTTDQLVWCQKKLGNISFVRRRVQKESSFLLFPC